MCVAQVYLTLRWASVRRLEDEALGKRRWNRGKGNLRRAAFSVLGPLSPPPALALGLGEVSALRSRCTQTLSPVFRSVNSGFGFLAVLQLLPGTVLVQPWGLPGSRLREVSVLLQTSACFWSCCQAGFQTWQMTESLPGASPGLVPRPAHSDPGHKCQSALRPLWVPAGDS